MSQSPYIKFLTDCLINLESNNVKVLLTKEPKVYVDFDKTYTKGFWDDASDPKNPTLSCSVYGPEEDWISIFAHEYCHFLQWIDKPKVWYAYSRLNSDVLSDCINNKPIKHSKLEYYLNTTRDIELDCEKRTVKLLSEYKLPLDLKKYIKGANIYIFYHNYLKISRKWHGKEQIPPHENKHLLNIVDSKFYSNYNYIPNDLLVAFINYYPPVKKSNLI